MNTYLLDLDGHLQIPPEILEMLFGKEASTLPGKSPQPSSLPKKPTKPFSAEQVWELKGSTTYGAHDPMERLVVMDAMQISKQLILPRVRVALAAWKGTQKKDDNIVYKFNEFMAEWQRADSKRLYGVGLLKLVTPSLTLMQIKHAQKLGLRALLLPCYTPPGDSSPGGKTWHPIWQALSEAGIAVVLHAGSEQGFIDPKWAPTDCMRAPVDSYGKLEQKIDVATVDMFKLLTMHYGPEVFISALMTGGVFGSFKDLRIAIVELGAGWVQPYLEMLDARASTFGLINGDTDDTRFPTEIFLDQIRVTPYHWEPVEAYLAHQDIYSVYAFSTDFPHSEGGHKTLSVAKSKLKHLPNHVQCSYFSGSAELILKN